MNSFRSLIGRSPNFEALLRSAQLVSAADVTVLITGETGTGKEVLATALQQSSPRAHKVFITLNCAALPESIAESELFGHSKGSFTGAISNQIGRLQAAHEGTLFLDEVDSLSLPLQAKLLRFLETGECQPVGHTHTQHVDVRVIAATNSCLKDKVAAGLFRNDLYYRLNVVPLELPSLRDRKSDIKQLIKYFVNKFSTEHKLDPPIFNNAAITRLTNYTLAGLIAGILGHVLTMPLGEGYGYRLLQILSALVMVGAGLYIAGWFPRFAYIEKPGARFWKVIEPLGRRLIPVSTRPLQRRFLNLSHYAKVPLHDEYRSYLQRVLFCRVYHGLIQ